MHIPDRLTKDQEEILITLRAILITLRALARATRRLLPALVGTAHARAYRRFAEDLVCAVYLEDGDAIARYGCDPATCTHEAHVRD